jgi:hypothetical protein
MERIGLTSISTVDPTPGEPVKIASYWIKYYFIQQPEGPKLMMVQGILNRKVQS